MRNFTKAFRKTCAIVLCAVLAGSAASATTYTALVSGNFNAGLTWGGTAPGSILSTDNVIIPVGVTVTMTGNETFSGTSSLTVLGTLTALPGTTLSITSGALAGVGAISADSMALGLTSGFTFTGPITARKLTSLGATIATAANVTVTKSLTLASGILTVGAGTLTMGSATTINVAGGTMTTIGSGLLGLDSLHNVTYMVTSTVTGMELGGLGVDTVTINTPGTVTMAASTTIKGTLSLAAGNLALAGTTLTFGPTAHLLASGTGMITGSASSNVIVNATGGLAGALRFATGLGGTLNSLVINTTTGTTALGSDVSINNLLTMTTGALALNGHTLTLNSTGNIAAGGTGTITGSALSSLVINTTGGLTGALNFTSGSNMLNNLTLNTGTGGAALASDLAVNGFMTLTSGTLSLAGHTLTLNPTADLSASGTGTLTGSATSNLVVNTTGSLTGALRFATGGNTLNNLVVNTGSGTGATLGSDLGVSGLLTLTAGTLSLAGHTLTLNPTSSLSASGVGTITGSATSSLVVNTTGGLTSTLRFATGIGGTLNNLTINTTTGATTLGSDLNINSLLTMTTGALALNGHTLTLNTTGNIAAGGTGTITGSALSSIVINTTGGLTGALNFTTGSNMLNNLTVNTVTGGVTLASDLAVSGLTTLTSGSLSLAGHTLTLNPTADLSAAGTGTLTGSATSNLVINTTGSLTGALRFATGGNTLNNLSVSTGAGSGATLGSDLGVSGLLTLTAGTLSLASHTLTLNPTSSLSATGTGTITGSTASSLVVNTTGGLTGALRFAGGSGGSLSNLAINTTTGVTTLGSDLSISNLLMLTSGAVAIGSNTLTLAATGNIASSGTGTLTGSTASSLVVNTTGGLTGALNFTTGSNMLNNLTVNTVTGGVTLASDLALSGTMILNSGSLSLSGHTLTLNPTADVSALGTGTLTGSATSNLVVNTTGSLTGALRFATGGNTLNNLSISTGTGAGASLGSDLGVSGMLTLTAGTLSIAGHTLTLNPTSSLSTSGVGTITGSTASSLVINTTGGLTGALRFATGGNTLNDLVVNTTTGITTLGSDLSISNLLTLTSGALVIGSNTLTLMTTGNIATGGTGTLTGSTASNLVVNTTGGLTGALNFTTGSSMLNNLTVNTVTGGVTLASDLAVSGIMTLTSGSLSLAGHTLTMNPTADLSATGTGTLTGSTTSSLIVNTTGSLTGALRFTSGGNTLNNLTLNTGSGAVATLGSDLGVSGLLTLTAGTLSLAGHTLTLNSTGNVAAGGTGTITGSSASSLIINSTGGLTGDLRFATGAGGTLKNLTVNTVSGAATLGSDLHIDDLLTLTTGSLALNGNTLTLNSGADLIAAGTGTLTGSASSNLVVNSTFSLTNAINFATGGKLLKNLTVNMGSGTSVVVLASNLTVDGVLALQSGKIELGAHDLDIASTGTVTGGSANSYVITDGTGSLIMNLATSARDTFKVGSVTNFAPLALTANAGSATGDVSVNVANTVLSNGTTGSSLSATDPLVSNTWFVSSTAGTINYNMTAFWNSSMEVNGFNRANAYISHYTSGAWDVQTGSAASVYGSMYAMSRTGITSLSPFMVAQSTSILATPVVNANDQNISLYPNPTSNTLNYVTTATISNIEIVSLTGQVVKSVNGSSTSVSVQDLAAGTYFIHFYGTDVNKTLKFVKD